MIIRKLPIVCGKCHMACEVKNLFYHECRWYRHRLNHCSCKEQVAIVLTYLNCHEHNYSVGHDFLSLANSWPVTNFLLVWLPMMAAHKGKRRRQFDLGWSTVRPEWLLSLFFTCISIASSYISFTLRHYTHDSTHAWVYPSVPLHSYCLWIVKKSNTINYDDIKCITVNR